MVGKTIDGQTLRALITRNGGEVIASDNIPLTPPRVGEVRSPIDPNAPGPRE